MTPPKPIALPALPVTAETLAARLACIRHGDTPERVHRALGGEPYQVEHREGKTTAFWRFRLRDAERPADPYELYMAEFEGDRLVFRAVLPHG